METKKGYYYGYDWKNEHMKGPVKGEIELRHYVDKTYFTAEDFRIYKYRVMRKPGAVNASRVINVWYEEPNDEEARRLIMEVLVKRKDKLEKELKSIEKSIEALAHMEKS